MREKGPGQGVYDWLKIEALSEIKEEAGVDLDKELDRRFHRRVRAPSCCSRATSARKRKTRS
jgi:hypothetical protein